MARLVAVIDHGSQLVPFLESIITPEKTPTIN